MDSNKYSRTIEMHCPTCGGTEFKSDEAAGAESPVTCTSCGLQLTRDDLREANGQNIAAHVDEVKKEVVQDIRKAFRDAFKGNKSFRIK